jgi:hypothetical protein
MGQKVNPTGIRLGIVRKHNSIWYADSKNYAKNLITDLQAREYIEKRLANASVSRVVIERLAQTLDDVFARNSPSVWVFLSRSTSRKCASPTSTPSSSRRALPSSWSAG